MRLRSFIALGFLILVLLVSFGSPESRARDDAPPSGLITTLKGHREAVYAITFSPDGKHLLTGSGDPAVKVWDAVSGKEVKSFGGPNGHKQLVLGVAVSGDGSQFATAAGDNSVRIWDFPTNKHLREFAQTAEATAVTVSNDGTKFASGTKDGKITLRNSEDGKVLFELTGHKGAVTGLTFSPNGQTLVSVSADQTIRYWNPLDGKLLSSLAAHSAPVNGVVYSPNNNAVYTTGEDGLLKFWTVPPVASRPFPLLDAGVTALSLSPDGTQTLAASGKNIRLFTTANGQLVKQFASPAGDITALTTSPGAALIAAGTTDRQLLLWQNKDKGAEVRLTAHGKPITGLAFNPGGDKLATASADGRVKLWLMPPVPTRPFAHPDVVRSAFSNDGKRLITGSADKLVRVWDLANNKAPERQFSGHTGAVNAVVASPDGQTIVSAGEDESIRFWNRTKGDEIGKLGAHTGPITSLTYTPAGQVLSTSVDGSVKLWQLPTTPSKNILAHAGVVSSAVLSPDGSRLLTGCADKQVRLWNLANGQVEKTFTGPTLGIQAVAYSVQGTRLAAGSADKSLWVWETAGKEVTKLLNLPAAVHTVAFSPDGKHVAAGLADGSAKLIDLTTSKEVQKYAGHPGGTQAILFSLKGDQVISAGADKVVRIWGTLDGVEKAKLDHGSPITALALSKDGLRLAAAGADKIVKLWTLADNKPAGTVTLPAVANGLSFSPDGKHLAVAGGDGKAQVLGADGSVAEYLSHEGPVQAVAFAPDGKKVYTASADKSARIWNLSLVWQARHAGPVRQALVSTRGIISASDDKTVKFWNVADGKETRSLTASPTAAIVGLGISTDASKLLTASADKTAKVWDLNGKGEDKPLVVIPLPGVPASATFSGNGQRVAIGVPGEKGGKDRVLIYDALTGDELLTLGEMEGAPANALTFLADNRTLLAAGADRTAQFIDINVQASFEAHPGGAASVAFSSAGTQLVTGGADKTVKLWNLTMNKVEKTFGPFAEPVSNTVFAPGGTVIGATAGKDVKVWTLPDGKEVLALTQPAVINGLSFNSDRTRLSTAGADGRVRVVDVASKLEVQGFLHEGAVTGVAFHPGTPTLILSSGADKSVVAHTVTNARVVPVGSGVAGLAITAGGDRIWTAGADGKLKGWNTGNGIADRTLDASDKPLTTVALTKNGQLIAAAGADSKVRVFGVNDNKMLALITPPKEVRVLAFAPNNQALVGACVDGSLVIWDVVYTPGQPLPPEFGQVLQNYNHIATDLAFSPVAPLFYSAGSDKTVKVWKLASDSPTKTFTMPGAVSAVAFNPAGTQVASGCADGRVRIHELAKGQLFKEIVAHNIPNMTAIYCVAWSPDGTQVVSGSIDQTLKLWDVASGKMVREFKAFKEKEFPKGHQEAVLSVAFSPDGKQIASGGMDKSIKIWNVADGSIVRELVNPAFKTDAHPGWVYGLSWTKAGKLISAGGAPRLRGYLAVWEPATGKLLSGQELAVGTVFSLAVSPDGKQVALGTGGSIRQGPELNQGVVLKTPGEN